MAKSVEVANLITQLQHKAAELNSADFSREALRGLANECACLADRISYRITQDIIAELRRNDPMPEHGFTGAAMPPPPRQYTVDDLL